MKHNDKYGKQDQVTDLGGGRISTVRIDFEGEKVLRVESWSDVSGTSIRELDGEFILDKMIGLARHNAMRVRG